MAESFTVETFIASDGYPLRYRRYRPTGEPRGHVVCIHGIQSHAGWYTHSCERLCQEGYLVSFLDRRGSGMNEQNRGDAPGFRRLLDDLAEFLRSHPKPKILLAISWGGKLAAALQRRHPDLVDGLILVCPGFAARIRPSLKQRWKIAWARVVAPHRRFPIPLSDPELFTASPHWQQFVREDRLALREATARLLIESVRLDGYLKVVPKHVRVPVLLLLAEQDRIIDNARTRRFVSRFAGPVEVIEYAGAHHTLEFEAKPEGFIGDMRSWLGRRASKVREG